MSDIVINPLRVLKTIFRVTLKKKIIEKYIVRFLLVPVIFLGIQTKMLFNCLNGALYVIIWKRLDSK